MPVRPTCLRSIGLTVALAAIGCLSPSLESGRADDAPPTAAMIERAIKQLGHDSYEEREAASRQLWEWGTVTEAPLRAAAAGGDAEARVRAKLILEKFALGITPGTPPEVERLVSQFQLQDLNEKRNTVQQLVNEKKVKIAFRLARMSKEEAERRELTYLVSRQAQRYIPDLLVAGDVDEAEVILESLDLTADSTLERLTAMYLVSGQLLEKLRAAEEKLKKEPNPGNVKRVVYFRRAAGDLTGAAELASRNDLFYYQRAILLEAGDWQAAAKAQQAQFQSPKLAAETLALSAALHSLSGEQPGMERRLEELRGNTVEQLSIYWDAAEAHLVCQQFDQATRLLEQSLPGAAVNISGLRMEYDRAFQLAGVTKETKFDKAWYDTLVDGGKVATQKSISRAEFALEVAFLLHQLGQRDQARQVAELIRAHAQSDNSGRTWSTALRVDIAVADRPRAVSDLQTALGNPNIARNELFRVLYPDDVPLAEILYAALGTGEAERGESLKIIEQALGPAGLGDAERGPLVAKISAAIEPWFEAKELRHVRAGELLLKLGDRERARKWFVKAADTTSDGQIRLGDLAREEQNWAEATKWYREATIRLPALPLPRYLLGHALLQQGEEEEGRKELHRASLAAISPSARYALAFQLKERDLFQGAEEQARLVQLTSNPTIQHPTLSAGHLHANLVFRTLPASAASAWQRWVLSQLMGVNNFTKFEYYLTDPELIHRNRARVLLAQKKPQQAMEELQRVLTILPGDARMVEEMWPLLEQAGHKPAGEELLSKVAGRYEQVIRDYPQTAHHRRELALLLARCGQKPDEALSLAKRAVELEPDVADHYDALAEAHFLRKEFPAAIAAGEKAVALERNSAEYKRRLARWKKGSPTR